MRKSYDTAFKVKVAIEAAKELETLQELSVRFEVSPGEISQWKRQLLDGAGELFERPNKKQKRERETEADRDRLLATVGKCTHRPKTDTYSGRKGGDSGIIGMGGRFKS